MTQVKATAQNVTLYPQQKAIVKRLAKETAAFNGNFSLALRFIIDDWWKHRQNNNGSETTEREDQ